MDKEFVSIDYNASDAKHITIKWGSHVPCHIAEVSKVIGLELEDVFVWLPAGGAGYVVDKATEDNRSVWSDTDAYPNYSKKILRSTSPKLGFPDIGPSELRNY